MIEGYRKVSWVSLILKHTFLLHTAVSLYSPLQTMLEGRKVLHQTATIFLLKNVNPLQWLYSISSSTVLQPPDSWGLSFICISRLFKHLKPFSMSRIHAYYYCFPISTLRHLKPIIFSFKKRPNGTQPTLAFTSATLSCLIVSVGLVCSDSVSWVWRALQDPIPSVWDV